MQHTEGESVDGVVGANAGSVGGVDLDAAVGVGDVLDDGVEEEAGVLGSEEGGGLAFDEGGVAAGVEDEVVLVGVLVEGGVLKAPVRARLDGADYRSHSRS